MKSTLAEDDRELKSGKCRHKGPLPHGYKPELDVTKELDADKVQRFQELIGILRWAIELGRVDILTEVALLSQYQANPQEGHRSVFDPNVPECNEDAFQLDAD